MQATTGANFTKYPPNPSPPTPPRTSFQWGPPLVPPPTVQELIQLRKLEEQRNELSSVLARLPPATSQIKLKVPSPLLQCSKCGLANSPQYSSLLKPLCPCALQAIAKEEEEAKQKAMNIVPPVNAKVLRRSRRDSRFLPPARSYSPRVCFVPPAKRGAKFHLALCANRPNNCVFAAIEFALGMAMQGEDCCCKNTKLTPRGRSRGAC